MVPLWQVVPILETYHVDALISGHDHNLQHIIRSDHLDIDYVVTGSGGHSFHEYNPENEDIVNQLGYQSLFFKGMRYRKVKYCKEPKDIKFNCI